MSRSSRAGLTFIVIFTLSACGTGGSGPGGDGTPGEIAGTQVMMDFSREEGFYASPFPGDDRRRPDGSIDLDGFPNPDRIPFVEEALKLLRAQRWGFGCTSAVYLRTTGAIRAENLPEVFQSVLPGAPVFLLCVDPASPDYLRRHPVDTFFSEDAGPFGAPNLLSLLPLQGIPLRPDTQYAAVVLRGLPDAAGAPLGVSLAMARIAAGQRPAELGDEAFHSSLAAVRALGAAGIAAAEIAGLAAFTTGDATAELGVFREHVLALPFPAPNRDFERHEVFEDYCVYETTIDMPVYQQGRAPFFCGGGDWAVDAAGNPVLQQWEEANLVVTVPRGAMPEAGFPIVIFSRTGGGGERPLVDRGRHAEPHGPPVTPGSGPALHFARAGFAGLSVDGPHGGLRNVTHGDEQFLVFNILNPAALRDNVRQSALEIILQAHLLEGLRLDASGCPGLTTPGNGPVRFDVTKMALMGHSTGATIVQPVLAMEPRFRAVILSGAGGSWIENLVWKQSPIEVKPLAELILNYLGRGREIHEHDPAVNLVQWAGEPADAPVYNRLLAERDAGTPLPHVLMLQGIVDTYILPPIANSTSLSLGLDLAGGSLDRVEPELRHFRPLGDLLVFSGGREIDLPASGNRSSPDGSRRTAVVVQHLEDGVEDGHEVVFQTDAPKQQYQGFLESLLQGVPVVPIPGNPLE